MIRLDHNKRVTEEPGDDDDHHMDHVYNPRVVYNYRLRDIKINLPKCKCTQIEIQRLRFKQTMKDTLYNMREKLHDAQQIPRQDAKFVIEAVNVTLHMDEYMLLPFKTDRLISPHVQPFRVCFNMTKETVRMCMELTLDDLLLKMDQCLMETSENLVQGRKMYDLYIPSTGDLSQARISHGYDNKQAKEYRIFRLFRFVINDGAQQDTSSHIGSSVSASTSSVPLRVSPPNQ